MNKLQWIACGSATTLIGVLTAVLAPKLDGASSKEWASYFVTYGLYHIGKTRSIS